MNAPSSSAPVVSQPLTDTGDQADKTRPRRVTLASLAVLLFGSGLNLGRALWAWHQAQALSDPLQGPLAWLAGASLIWGLLFALCAVGLWRLARWGYRGTWVTLVAYHAYIWGNHIAFDRSDYARQMWPFAAAHSLIVLGVAGGYLYGLRRLYHGERKGNDSESENTISA